MPGMDCWGRKKAKENTMTASAAMPAERVGALEPSDISCRNTAALALTIVRDGVITGEGPTTKGRVHFSRALDADDAAWCARILTATAVEHQPVSRAEAEALFEINDAAALAAAERVRHRDVNSAPCGGYHGGGVISPPFLFATPCAVPISGTYL